MIMATQVSLCHFTLKQKALNISPLRIIIAVALLWIIFTILKTFFLDYFQKNKGEF